MWTCKVKIQAFISSFRCSAPGLCSVQGRVLLPLAPYYTATCATSSYYTKSIITYCRAYYPDSILTRIASSITLVHKNTPSLLWRHASLCLTGTSETQFYPSHYRRGRHLCKFPCGGYQRSDQKWRHRHYISHYTNDHLIYFQWSCFPIPIPHNFVINDLTLSFLGYQLTFVDGAFTILPIVICASPPLFLLSDVPRVRSCECERIHEVVIPFLSPPVILPTHKVITSSPPLTRSTTDAKFTFSLLDISLQMR
jgi:hypothetical protein